MRQAILLQNSLFKYTQVSFEERCPAFAKHLYYMYDMNLSVVLLGNQRIVSQISLIVSPCISPGEKQIATAVLEAQLPLIVLLLKGFPPFFKPQPRYLMACAEGRLLMLSPYPWQNEKIENMRQRCLHLNDIAAEICKS